MIKEFEFRLSDRLPQIHNILQINGISMESFLYVPFITICQYQIEIQYSLQIMDLFLIKKHEIFFELVLNLFQKNSTDILSLNNNDLFAFLHLNLWQSLTFETLASLYT